MARRRRKRKRAPGLTRRARQKRRYVRRRRRKPIRKQRKTVTGFPDVHKVTLRFCETVAADQMVLQPSSMAPSNGARTVYHVCANNLWAPDDVATNTHQPMYRDTWSKIYNTYTVVGSKIRMKVAWASPQLQNPIKFGIILNDNKLVPTGVLSYASMCEQRGENNDIGFKRWKTMYANAMGANVLDTSAYAVSRPIRAIHLTKGYSLRKFLEIPKKDGVINNRRMEFGTTQEQMLAMHTAATLDDKPVYFHLMCCVPFSITSPRGGVRLEYEVDYAVVLTNGIFGSHQ